MPTTAPSYECIPTSEFLYNKDQDCYICPSGEVMKRIGDCSRKHYVASIYKTTACETCTIRQDCTQNKQGRVLERTQYQGVGENKERVLANPGYYKLRQQIIEYQFGTVKRQWGFTFTLLREK
ncbi:transposase [Chitinophaga sp. OAE865]|uniref:transposase n=1 Tax=Chitinophaga sp. OAE865 TaxID=2817898 RepID=UPI001AE51779